MSIYTHVCIYDTNVHMYIYRDISVFYESDGTGSNFLKICKFNCDECK